MGLTYDQIAQYVEEYFAAFNAYGQNPELIHRMDDYFAKDFPDDFQAPLAIIHAGNCLAEQRRIDDAAPYYARALPVSRS